MESAGVGRDGLRRGDDRFPWVERLRRGGRRIAIEIDGALHLLVSSYWQDMDRHNELVIAGEFAVSLPSAEYRTKQLEEKGAPISWHCPEPVPLTILYEDMTLSSE